MSTLFLFLYFLLFSIPLCFSMSFSSCLLLFLPFSSSLFFLTSSLLNSLYFPPSQSLFLPISTTYLSFSISLFISFLSMLQSVSVSTSLSTSSHGHNTYFKFSVISTSVTFQDWHLLMVFHREMLRFS